MKKIFTISAIVLTTLFFAQEAGKAGELLKNEAGTREMQTQNRNVFGQTSKNDENKGFRNGNQTGNAATDRNKNRNPNYQWNYNYGYSEVFLRIPERGYFTVEIGDQMMGNTSGKFRFFDLNAGSNTISIYQNNFLVYRTHLNIRNNTRMVLDFFTNYGLYLLDSYPVQNQNYGINDWNDVWNNPYGNGNFGGNNGYYGNVMSDRNFDQFINALRKNAFDDNKIEFIKQQRNTMFTAQQIKVMLGTMSFDNKKLELAKMLYRNCADQNNFFIVYDIFAFESSKRELMKYVSGSF